jgi:hypothetical protein
MTQGKIDNSRRASARKPFFLSVTIIGKTTPPIEQEVCASFGIESNIITITTMKRLYHHNGFRYASAPPFPSLLLWSLFLLLLPTFAFFANAATTTTTTTTTATFNYHRPELVQKALADKKPIYYFGLGSNMSREKIEQRTAGSNITICSMEPAIVPGHRLAFNMRGFPPLEPGMGSLEPIIRKGTMATTSSETISRPVLAYDKDECHGALVLLSADDYEALMRTEGVGPHVKDPGYEEVVVWAYPYSRPKNTNKNHPFSFSGQTPKPVLAVALRARPHVRLLQDPCPSQRYMDLLRKGAKELQLVDDYQDFLLRHPVQEVSRLLGKIAVHNLVFLSIVSFKWKLRFISKLQSWVIYRIISSPQGHPPPHIPQQKQQKQQQQASFHLSRVLRQVAMGIVLLPGALVGFGLLHYLRAIGKVSPFMKQMIDRY